ncbi:phospholipase [Allopusillimonas soli]|uniref:Phospholipase A1 n=1 Tax=Allopusillimonas soli TaxID=659016 RepID=A0A853FFF2_9BURK|nr:phospholipase A [Allopusillimonas soli]NYT38617.1 phospholipase A [Allopusillimonas soli]TEA71671.1 phospholipase [Allopusillimonas soli]
MSFPPLSRYAIVATGVLLCTANATAGITYKLSQPQALPGQTVDITGVLFNDTQDSLSWSPPHELVIQWRGQDGQVIRSLAQLADGSGEITLPVNNFVTLVWHAQVPAGLTGLQAVNVEGDSTLMALDTGVMTQVASAPATGPVVDTGKVSADGQSNPPLPATTVAEAHASPSSGPTPVAVQASGSNAAFDNFRNAFSPYEPVYFDLGNNNGRNARFQLSFKYRLFQPEDASNPSFVDNFYLAYTQTSLWDLFSDSHPFVDTSFKPSVFWRKDALWESPGHNWFTGLQSGVEHESNGKDGDDTRSLNFVYVQPEFNYRFSGGSTLTFAPKIKSYFSMDENPDYSDYFGHVDWKLRWAQDNGLVLSGLYRQGHGGHYATQLEAAWPLRRTPLNMNGYLHVQYFKGYGETLLDYNHKVGSQIRIGLALVP